MKIDFSPLAATDYEPICEMVNVIYDEHILSLNTKEGTEKFRQIISPENLRNKKAEGYVLRKILADGTMIGLLGIDGFHIRYLFIKTSFQKIGIGKKAVQWSIEYLRSNKISDKITLFSSPNSTSAYEKMGFFKTGDEFSVNGIRAVPYQLSIK